MYVMCEDACIHVYLYVMRVKCECRFEYISESAHVIENVCFFVCLSVSVYWYEYERMC